MSGWYSLVENGAHTSKQLSSTALTGCRAGAGAEAWFLLVYEQCPRTNILLFATSDGDMFKLMQFEESIGRGDIALKPYSGAPFVRGLEKHKLNRSIGEHWELIVEGILLNRIRIAPRKTSGGCLEQPKNVNEALGDESWIVAMQEELNQFVANDVWELVPQPRNMTIIGTKWVFRNKLDENGIVSRNKARLVAQGYNQQEGIDYDETYAPVARLESIRILLAYACALDFKLFQMDVKSAFLNGFINEEVYVAQPPGFIDFEKPDHVYKLKKALYGLKQAPKVV
ncbi:retrovirus-related pol polyprotein from transposon TNT 1-94 [Tanacetum coccineum]|uniref:Retrovirus-related pol polyprotein from transposon TNT 1-94 n=1 Tax=Tanacetum coccineum TaxID=301880 RepID=A0ABQ5E0C9_9ASTR